MTAYQTKTTNIFHSKRSKSFGYFLLISGAVVILITVLPTLIYSETSITAGVVSGGIGIIVAAFFLWCWISTFYSIKNEILTVRFGPIVWKVPVKDISEVRLNQETFGGTWKLTLSWKSMEIKYRKNKSVFISPENEKMFLELLLKINGTITISAK